MDTPVSRSIILVAVAAAFFYLGTLFPDLIQGSPDIVQGTVTESADGGLVVMTDEGERRIPVSPDAIVTMTSERRLESSALIPAGSEATINLAPDGSAQLVVVSAIEPQEGAQQ